MMARYLIRMDDACPTMDHERWERIENLLDAYSVKPVVAVVPDNHDPKLMVGEYDPNFWDRVRSWKNKGWWVAMHGCTHVMHYTESEQIFPFYKRSEFSGLSYEQQSEKIKKSAEKFKDEGIMPDAWIAPGHCFDHITLQALQDNTDIRVISDGMATDIYHERGFYWIPQQLWGGFRKLQFGLWTVCLHPNGMSERQCDHFQQQLDQYSDHLASFSDLELKRRKRGALDRAVNAYYWLRRGEYRAGIR